MFVEWTFKLCFVIYSNSPSVYSLATSVQLLSCVRLFETPWIAACQASLSITNSRSPLKPMSIESVMPSNHLILCRPLLLLPSIFPSIRVLSSESVLHIRLPEYWSFSFSISPSSEYLGLDFLWNWLVWSPCCLRDSQKSSPAPQFESISSSALSLLYGSILISIHDYWNYLILYLSKYLFTLRNLLFFIAHKCIHIYTLMYISEIA